jgi:hypothetical protein
LLLVVAIPRSEAAAMGKVDAVQNHRGLEARKSIEKRSIGQDEIDPC